MEAAGTAGMEATAGVDIVGTVVTAVGIVRPVVHSLVTVALATVAVAARTVAPTLHTVEDTIAALVVTVAGRVCTLAASAFIRADTVDTVDIPAYMLAVLVFILVGTGDMAAFMAGDTTVDITAITMVATIVITATRLTSAFPCTPGMQA
jgi:hypothetical protein